MEHPSLQASRLKVTLIILTRNMSLRKKICQT